MTGLITDGLGTQTLITDGLGQTGGASYYTGPRLVLNILVSMLTVNITSSPLVLDLEVAQ